MRGVRTRIRSEVAVVEHIPGQVGLDSRLPGSFAGAAEDNTHLALEVGLERRSCQST